MLKLLNTKLLIAILAVLAALASAAIYNAMRSPKLRPSWNSNSMTPNSGNKKMKPFAKGGSGQEAA